MALGLLVGGFFKAHGVKILGAGLVFAAGWYIFGVIQENGRLEAELEDEQEKVSQWEDRFDQLQSDRSTLAKWDTWLAEQRELTQQQGREYTRRLSELRDEVVGLKDYLDMQPPGDFREFLCNNGLVLSDLCEGGSREVPYRLSDDSG